MDRHFVVPKNRLFSSSKRGSYGTTSERDGAMLRESAPGELDVDEDVEDRLFTPLDQLADLPEDMSFARWLASSDVPKEQHAALRSYVEGFNAADADRISACRGDTAHVLLHSKLKAERSAALRHDQRHGRTRQYASKFMPARRPSRSSLRQILRPA